MDVKKQWMLRFNREYNLIDIIEVDADEVERIFDVQPVEGFPAADYLPVAFSERKGAVSVSDWLRRELFHARKIAGEIE